MEINDLSDVARVSVIDASVLTSLLTDLEINFEGYVEEWEDANKLEDFKETSLSEFETGEEYAEDQMSDLELYEALQEVSYELELAEREGNVLINESYFEEYVGQLIDDCYKDISDVVSTGSWPYKHVIIDTVGAAEELKNDYREINVGDTTFLTLA